MGTGTTRIILRAEHAKAVAVGDPQAAAATQPTPVAVHPTALAFVHDGELEAYARGDLPASEATLDLTPALIRARPMHRERQAAIARANRDTALAVVFCVLLAVAMFILGLLWR